MVPKCVACSGGGGSAASCEKTLPSIGPPSSGSGTFMFEAGVGCSGGGISTTPWQMPICGMQVSVVSQEEQYDPLSTVDGTQVGSELSLQSPSELHAVACSRPGSQALWHSP